MAYGENWTGKMKLASAPSALHPKSRSRTVNNAVVIEGSCYLFPAKTDFRESASGRKQLEKVMDRLRDSIIEKSVFMELADPFPPRRTVRTKVEQKP